MTPPLNRALHRVSARTFEELCFFLPLPEPEDYAEARPIEIASCVGFEGPMVGRLVVGCQRELLAPLAANMLGETDGVSDSQEFDAFAELTNVICGNFLPTLAGPEAVFRITAPYLLAPDDLGSWPPPTAEACLTLDQGWARILLYLDDILAAKGTCP